MGECDLGASPGLVVRYLTVAQIAGCRIGGMSEVHQGAYLPNICEVAADILDVTIGGGTTLKRAQSEVRYLEQPQDFLLKDERYPGWLRKARRDLAAAEAATALATQIVESVNKCQGCDMFTIMIPENVDGQCPNAALLKALHWQRLEALREGPKDTLH